MHPLRAQLEAIFAASPSTNAGKEWQDEFCLAPIQHIPRETSLCNACRMIFHTEPSLERVRHVRCLKTLRISAHRGCRLCVLILDRLDDDDPNGDMKKQVNIECRGSVYKNGWAREIRYKGYIQGMHGSRRAKILDYIVGNLSCTLLWWFR